MSVSLGTAVGYLDIDSSKFSSGIESAVSKLKVFGDETATSMDKLGAAGDVMTSVGGGMTTALTLPILGAGAAIMKVGSDFETGMSKVQAISMGSAEDMERLKEKAIEMGASTKFSASESADAFMYMAQAGWDTEAMINGISGIMDLAAADGIELATASNIVTDALTAFGLQAEDSAHFADVLAMAASASNTDVTMMGESFKYVGPLAGALGYTVEDTSLALGLMANSGIKASQAGTTLRATLANLADPTDTQIMAMEKYNISITNADGSMKSLDTLMVDLRGTMALTTDAQRAENFARAEAEALANGYGKEMATLTNEEKQFYLEAREGEKILKGLTETETNLLMKQELGIKITKNRKMTEEDRYNLAATLGEQSLRGMTEAEQAQIASTIFGTNAMSGMLAVINASEESYTGLSEQINNADGTAKAMAETMQDNLAGQMEELGGTIETIALQFYDVMVPAARGLVEVLQKCADWFQNLSVEQKQMIVVIAGVVAAIGPVLLILGSLAGAVVSVSTAFGILAPIVAGAGGVVAGILVPIGLVIAAVAALKFAWENNLGGIQEKTAEIFEAIKELITTVVDKIKAGVEAFLSALQYAWENNLYGIQNMVQLVWDMISTIISTVLDVIKGIIDVAMSVISGDWQGAWEGVKKIFDTIWQGIKKLLSQFIDLLIGIIVAAVTGFKDAATKAFEAIKEGFTTVWEAIKEWFDKAKDDPVNTILGIATDLYNAGVNIFTSLWDGLKSVWNNITGWVSDAIDWLRDKVESWKDMMSEMDEEDEDDDGSHRGGLDYVPYDGYRATLHTGERVVTAEDAASGSGSGGNTFVFYSPEAIDEKEAAKLFKQTQQQIALGF